MIENSNNSIIDAMNAIEDIGKNSFEQELRDAGNRALHSLIKIGKILMDEKSDLLLSRNVNSIEKIGLLVVKQKDGFKVKDILNFLLEIGDISIDFGLANTSREVIRSIASIGTESIENNLYTDVKLETIKNLKHMGKHAIEKNEEYPDAENIKTLLFEETINNSVYYLEEIGKTVIYKEKDIVTFYTLINKIIEYLELIIKLLTDEKLIKAKRLAQYRKNQLEQEMEERKKEYDELINKLNKI